MSIFHGASCFYCIFSIICHRYFDYYWKTFKGHHSNNWIQCYHRASLVFWVTRFVLYLPERKMIVISISYYISIIGYVKGESVCHKQYRASPLLGFVDAVELHTWIYVGFDSICNSDSLCADSVPYKWWRHSTSWGTLSRVPGKP